SWRCAGSASSENFRARLIINCRASALLAIASFGKRSACPTILDRPLRNDRANPATDLPSQRAPDSLRRKATCRGAILESEEDDQRNHAAISTKRLGLGASSALLRLKSSRVSPRDHSSARQ